MVAPLRAADVRRKYDRIAPWFDLLEGPLDLLLFKKRRRVLLSRAKGLVLEVAAGTGKNFSHYPADCRIVATDLSWEMVVQARRKAKRLRRRVLFIQADAERLPLRGEIFQRVVCTLSLCTVADPGIALREMSRTCKPEGEILLLEHVRSHKPFLARLQRRLTPGNVRRIGCHLDRETVKTIRALGLPIRERADGLWGILQSLVVGPRTTGGGIP